MIKKKKKKNQNCIKYRLSQFLFLQHKMYYVALVAIFIIFIYHCIICCFLSLPMSFIMLRLDLSYNFLDI